MFSQNARVHCTVLMGTVLMGAVLLTLLSSACSKKEATPFDYDVKQAVVKLQSGDVVARIDSAHGSASSDADKIKWASLSEFSAEWPAFIEPLAGASSSARDSHDCVIKKTEENTEGTEEAIRLLGVCLRQSISPALLAIQAMGYWKAYELPAGLRPLSELSDQELQLFLMTQYKKPEAIVANDPATEPLLKLQRRQFTDADLKELLELVKRRDHALMVAEKKISNWFSSSTQNSLNSLKNAVKMATKSWDRYEGIERLVSEAVNSESGQIERSGVAAFKSLTPLLLSNAEITQQFKAAGLLTASGVLNDRAQEALPIFNLHPYALLALIPRAGDENTALHGNGQNPFFVIRDFQGELGDFSGKLTESNSVIESTFEKYKKYRDQDLKKSLSLSLQKPFARDSVKIAFIDTGIDYLAFPELAPFLSQGSVDYADLDDSPYLPGIALLDHGTATTASLLTVLSQKAPEILQNRGIELAMWKLSSLRSLLSGALENDLWRWNPRHTIGFFDLLLDQQRKILGGGSFLPKIVSFSASFQSRDFLGRSGQQSLLKKTPWLWVMAAGNEGVNIDQAKTACFQDIPEPFRGQDHILCVGALVKRQGTAKVAAYSNFGDAVSVYAYESYERLCPSGTSCATPAISAAATLIASKFPSLSPAEIKQVILDAAEEKTLEVDLDARAIANLVRMGQAIPSRSVKVFDPLTRMDEALRLASLKVQSVNLPK